MVEPGRLRFHDAAPPPLTSGRYRFRVAHALAGGVAGAPGDGVVEVEVGALADGVGRVSAYPGDGATGGFADELPFMVLDRRTLPWERAGFGQAEVPWLTVLVTREDGAAEAVLDPAGGAGAGTLRCTSVAVQSRLLATPAEVRLLAHVRETAVGDTPLAGDDADGWQAVVVANRLPRTAGRWRATLVALDGRADLLGGAPVLGLTALHSVTFTVSDAGGGFGARLAALVPGRFADPATHPGVDVTGAVRVTRRDRRGREQPVRYRPPLLAGAAQLAAPDGPDPAPDVTATAAAELGRLLSAADQGVLRALAQWHRTGPQERARRVTDAALAEALPGERRAAPRSVAEQAVAAALLRWGVDDLPRTRPPAPDSPEDVR